MERNDVEGVHVVMLAGVIDEHADLGFFSELGGKVRISLKNVRRINSYGVRSWIDAVRKIPEGTSLEFIECPPPVVDQMNMVAGFLGRGRVKTFYVPMMCESCDVEQDQLFETSRCRGGKLPPVECPECGEPMEVDDIEEQYLLFLKEG